MNHRLKEARSKENESLLHVVFNEPEHSAPASTTFLSHLVSLVRRMVLAYAGQTDDNVGKPPVHILDVDYPFPPSRTFGEYGGLQYSSPPRACVETMPPANEQVIAPN